MDILNGKKRFGMGLAQLAQDEHSHIKGLSKMLGQRIPALSEVDSEGEPIPARVYRNMWIVDCPDCRNAEFAWTDEPRFLCTNCWNGMVGGKWRIVAFPQFTDAIEKALKARPVPHTRNWNPGESYQQLRAENRANGLPEEEV